MGMESYLGDWTHNTQSLHETFVNAKPFEHVVIPNFFEESFANAVFAEFPNPHESCLNWKHYDNPIEQKYSLNEFDGLPAVQKAFQILQDNALLSLVRSITGIDSLDNDPHLHGAGLHAYPHQGKLDMHLDYSIHPITGKERRVNLIIYMNRNWKDQYGGGLQLMDASFTKSTDVIMPAWNTAVLFRTSDMSYHGIPIPIQCPTGEYRRSLAIYYVSPPREGATKRYKAEFFPLPNQPVDDRLQKLYDVRKSRLITQEDLEAWPSWRQDGQGHW
jgi:Rps23 Pro-64 3,4-dihydroxylase Tpa1-like proline 4-hydroxylase